MSDVLIRHIAMLSLIPGAPRKVSARELHAGLANQGFMVDVRSVERDLHKLSTSFALVSDQAKPAGWSFASRQTQVSFPSMDAGTAMTYELLARYLTPILPRGLLKQLKPQFAAARRVLQSYAGMPVARWSRSIAVLPHGQQLVPPEVKTQVVDIVYGALLAGRQFEADYRSASSEQAKRYVFNPLGLVYQESVLYLVASLWHYDDPRVFALQRLSEPRASDVPATMPADFDFQRYIREQRPLEFSTGRYIRLELQAEEWLARHLSERHLSSDQTISRGRDGEFFRVTATVADTEKLFWWLSSHGTSVQVLKPAALRRKMARQAERLASIYSVGHKTGGRT